MADIEIAGHLPLNIDDIQRLVSGVGEIGEISAVKDAVRQIALVSCLVPIDMRFNLSGSAGGAELSSCIHSDRGQHAVFHRLKPSAIFQRFRLKPAKEQTFRLRDLFRL